MSNAKQLTARLSVSILASWISSGFLSFVILAACIIPVAWALNLDVTNLEATSLDLKNLCQLVIFLSVAMGISAFLANYVLLGHPTAYTGSLFVILSSNVMHNSTIFILATAPIAIGAICAHYLNRYTRYQAKRAGKPNATLNFVIVRYLCVCGVIFMTLALLDRQFHWVVYLIWIAKLALYLAMSFHAIWRRGNAQIAG